MKAAILRSHGAQQPYHETRALSIEDVDLAPPGWSEVKVQIKAAGLCHSDLSTINGDRLRPVPMVLGHEAAGIVVECGPGIADLVPGDSVVMVFVPSCGHCLPCMEGRPALCEPGAAANGAGTLLSGERRLHDHGGDLHHHLGVSAFAEFAVTSRRSLIKIDRDLPFDEAALFGCAVLTGVGAVVNTARVPAGAKVAVLGLGGVGMNALLGAIASGAADIVAVDLFPEKLAFALELGATAAVNARDPDAIEQVKGLTRGGVDFAFEMAGSVQAMEAAYRMTRRGGTTVSAGLPNPEARWPLQHVNMVADRPCRLCATRRSTTIRIASISVGPITGGCIRYSAAGHTGAWVKRLRKPSWKRDWLSWRLDFRNFVWPTKCRRYRGTRASAASTRCA